MLKSRPAGIDDIEEIMTIEEESFSNPWSRRNFELELTNPLAHYQLLTLSNIVIGYAGAYLLADEAHIGNVAIDFDYRGKGYGKYLMNHFLFALHEKGARAATLEVRDDNFPAIKLYKSLGFVLEGVRKNYYQDVKRDALILWKRWGE